MNLTIAPRRTVQGLLLAVGAMGAQAAWAQFSTVPTPQCQAPEASSQSGEQEFRVDAENRIVTTPAYMLAGRISEAAEGIERLVAELLKMVSASTWVAG